MFIVACVVSSDASTDSKALKFAGFWTVLLMIALVIGGTLVMRRYQTPLALGFFLGVVVFMANQCLILTAIFGEEVSGGILGCPPPSSRGVPSLRCA